MDKFSAIINEIGVIEANLSTSFYDGISKTFQIKDKYGVVFNTAILSSKKTDNVMKYFIDSSTIKIGEEYYLMDDHNLSTIIQYGLIVKSSQFDLAYYYDGDDLGPNYSKEKTTFKVWAPTAANVFVQLFINSEIITHQMIKGVKGVFSKDVLGDLEGVNYQYLVRVNGEYKTAIDPYAYASSPNTEYSTVIDLAKTNINLAKDVLLPLENYSNAIIYELSVRDFSFDPASNLKNRSKFLAFSEENVTTNRGYPSGIEYLTNLGITHLQLLPIYDFGSVDELNQFSKYNWGYDPVNYNVPEGSYASDVRNPYSRIIEFKQMVQALHKRKIRINMDVVYNHMFDRFSSSFEKLVPNYYFRLGSNGEISNGSYCGNDFDSTRLMASKFIVDSVKRWMNFYGIDGFRFDLMGIIDIDTMNKVVEEARKIDPSVMIYGEGWDMPTLMKDELKAAMKNQHKLDSIAHFNDRFREVVKGSTWHDEITHKGYASGESKQVETFINVMMGSCTSVGNYPLFSSADKSVNYVECHDNNTLWDKLLKSNKEESEELRKKRQRLMLAIVLFSQGIPFIHAGQEFFRTKKGEHNSYMSSDEINLFDYTLMGNNYDSVIFAQELITFRKENKIFHLTTKEEIYKRYNHKIHDNGLLEITIDATDISDDYHTLKIIINNSSKVLCLNLDEYYRVLVNEFGLIKIDMYGQNLMINPASLQILVK